jgi:hypothetical protein
MSFALFISNFQLVSVRGGIHDFGDYSTLNIILYPKTISCTNVLLQSEGRALAGVQLGTGQEMKWGRVYTIQYTERMAFLVLKRFVRTAACLDYSDSLTRLRLGMHQVLNHGFFASGLV